VRFLIATLTLAFTVAPLNLSAAAQKASDVDLLASFDPTAMRISMSSKLTGRPRCNTTRLNTQLRLPIGRALACSKRCWTNSTMLAHT
jgi:hypothetical protein